MRVEARTDGSQALDKVSKPLPIPRKTLANPVCAVWWVPATAVGSEMGRLSQWGYGPGPGSRARVPEKVLWV